MSLLDLFDRSESRLDFASELLDAVDNDYELHEEEGEFVLTVELPGFSKEEIDVRWHDDRLTVRADSEDEDRGRRRQFVQTFRFPEHVDEEGIEGTYNNGILELRLPVEEESEERGREIEITE